MRTVDGLENVFRYVVVSLEALRSDLRIEVGFEKSDCRMRGD